MTLTREEADLRDKLLEVTQEKDRAYDERNRVVAALARAAILIRCSTDGPDPRYRAGLIQENLDDVNDVMKTWVIVELDGDQLAWNIHDRDKILFDFLPPFEGKRKPATEKYSRLELWTRGQRRK